MASPVSLNSLLEHYQLKEEDYNRPISDQHLDEIARSSCSQWRSLRPELGLKKIVEDDIERDLKNEEAKRRSFFYKWKHLQGSGTTYKRLVGALLKIGCQEDAESVCQLLQRSTDTPEQSWQAPSLKHRASARQSQPLDPFKDRSVQQSQQLASLDLKDEPARKPQVLVSYEHVMTWLVSFKHVLSKWRQALSTLQRWKKPIFIGMLIWGGSWSCNSS